jgi:hypothetical protein
MRKIKNANNKNPDSQVKIAWIGAISAILIAVIGILKFNSGEPEEPKQEQKVNISNQPVIVIKTDTNADSNKKSIKKNKEEAVRSKNIKQPDKSSGNKLSKKDLNKYISAGENFKDKIRGNEDNIIKWEGNCRAVLGSLNSDAEKEYDKFKNGVYHGNPPYKNIVDTLLQLLKNEREKLPY